MTPTNTHHTIRSVSTSDFDAIEALWDARFGTAESMIMGEQNLVELAVNCYSNCDIYVATSPSDELIGFAVGFVASSETLHDWIGEKAAALPTAPLNGFVQAIAVDPDWEHQGVASALLNRLITRFTEIGAEEVYAVSWRRDNTVDSSGLFEKLAFEDLAHIEEFYAQGDHPRQDCPDCPSNPCTCDGTVYHKTL